ncbi:hypothetical protein E1293_46600, partial [Actinomadura darangshiensis]
MTEDNRGPVRAPSEDDDVAPGQEPERQEAAAPPETVTDQEISLDDPVDDPEVDDPGPVPEDDAGHGAAEAGEDGDRLVAGGFAPPDSLGGPPDTNEDVLYSAGMAPQEVPLQDAPPRDMPQPPPVALDKRPDMHDDRGRPGFVPHNQDPRAAQAGPYGGWPQQAH